MTILKHGSAAFGAALCATVLLLGSSPIAQAAVAQPVVVSAVPAAYTPRIVLGTSGQTVYAFAQVGSTMYTGGKFAQIQNSTGTITYDRQNFAAFDANTGAVSPLSLSFDGIVHVIVAADDGKSIYIGGAFKHVNGAASKAIIKYDLVNSRIDPTFQAPTANGTVWDAKMVNGRLIVVGTLRKYLLALNPTTGADTNYLNLPIAGVTNPDDVTKVRRFATNPAGTKLVAIGNFATVGGQSRKQAFEVDLGASTTTLSTWHPPRLDFTCPANNGVVQGVDFSPDGSYFAVVTTGAPSGTNGLCDATARFETANVSPTVEPTWINWTGGDSLYSVAVTGAAVYVGGHQRWLDNPFGRDSKGPGAVDRPGIGAIDPVTGKALPWNPTKDRNHGTEKLYATPTGLWVGSDGARFALKLRPGIAFCPLP